MNRHDLHYVDMHPEPIRPRTSLLQDVCAAIIFAGFIALPFVLYFAFVMKP